MLVGTEGRELILPRTVAAAVEELRDRLAQAKMAVRVEHRQVLLVVVVLEEMVRRLEVPPRAQRWVALVAMVHLRAEEGRQEIVVRGRLEQLAVVVAVVVVLTTEEMVALGWNGIVRTAQAVAAAVLETMPHLEVKELNMAAAEEEV